MEDITQNITMQTERMYISELSQIGIASQEIAFLVKNQKLHTEIGEVVEYILFPKTSVNERYMSTPEYISDIQKSTLTAVRNHYLEEFSADRPENYFIGDIYAGLTNGYLPAYKNHNGINVDGSSYWYNKEGDLKGNLCAEFFANAIPALYLGNDDQRKSLQRLFPQTYPVLQKTVEEMKTYMQVF